MDQKGLLRIPIRLRVRSYVTDPANFDDFDVNLRCADVRTCPRVYLLV